LTGIKRKSTLWPNFTKVTNRKDIGFKMNLQPNFEKSIRIKIIARAMLPASIMEIARNALPFTGRIKSMFQIA